VKDDENNVDECILKKSGSNSSTLSEHSNASKVSKQFSNNLDNSSLTNENENTENIAVVIENGEIEMCPKVEKNIHID
jgi:hypothetical protein